MTKEREAEIRRLFNGPAWHKVDLPIRLAVRDLLAAFDAAADACDRLEQERITSRDAGLKLYDDNAKLQERIAALGGALEFYASRETYLMSHFVALDDGAHDHKCLPRCDRVVILDDGQTAREALARATANTGEGK